jgi:hypothetical protein
MFDDGIYGLSFESRAVDGSGRDRGEGLAVLRAGRIVGSDPHGGVFIGSYQYDAARGDDLVTVRISVPPHGVLLTGFEAGPDGAVVEVSARFAEPRPVASAVVDVAGAPVEVELRYVGALAD